MMHRSDTVAMYCPSCGEEVSENSRYCSRCGESLSGDRFETRSSGGSGWDTGADVDDAGTSTPTTSVESGDTTMAALTHILALFTWVLGPVIVYIVAEDDFVKENAKNAINWQIIYLVYLIVSFVLILVVVGLLAIVLLGVLDFVFCVVAAVKASDGEAWKYPFTPDIL